VPKVPVFPNTFHFNLPSRIFFPFHAVAKGINSVRTRLFCMTSFPHAEPLFFATVDGVNPRNANPRPACIRPPILQTSDCAAGLTLVSFPPPFAGTFFSFFIFFPLLNAYFLFLRTCCMQFLVDGCTIHFPLAPPCSGPHILHVAVKRDNPIVSRFSSPSQSNST